MATDFEAALAAHRPSLLRHCYRMLGSFAEAEDLLQDSLERAWRARESYRGEAPLKRWLFTIATHTCLNALEKRKRLTLPQFERAASGADFVIDEGEPSAFITPAPDERLFPDPSERLESRESVALAFVALLQKVPPKQRAALLMKDVLGWSAEEIAEALGLSLSSVNSALHRAREATARLGDPAELRSTDEPTPDLLQRFVQAWESHDLDGLIALLRQDVELAMPPYEMWFRGTEAVRAFFRSPRFAAFWSAGVRLVPLRVNGAPGFAFYRAADEDTLKLHSIMVARFRGGLVEAMDVFVGPTYFAKFDLPSTIDRTVLGTPVVMMGKGAEPT